MLPCYSSSSDEENDGLGKRKRTDGSKGPRKRKRGNPPHDEYLAPQAFAVNDSEFPFSTVRKVSSSTQALATRDAKFNDLYSEFFNLTQPESKPTTKSSSEKQSAKKSDVKKSNADKPVEPIEAIEEPGQTETQITESTREEFKYVPTEEELNMFAEFDPQQPKDESRVEIAATDKTEKEETAEKEKDDYVWESGVCHIWAKTGSCPKGEHCKWKHMDKSNTCWEYERFKTCSYGDYCRFIHGVPEPCAMYSSVGLCSFGDKCRFRHDKKKFSRLEAVTSTNYT